MPVKNVVAVPDCQPHDSLQRLLEVVWGLVPFVWLGMIVALSFYKLTAAAVLLLVYTLVWFLRLLGFAYRLVGSYLRHRHALKVDWRKRLTELSGDLESPLTVRLPYQAIIVAIYNEPAELLEATLKAVKESDYDPERIILLVAYEERGGTDVELAAERLVTAYVSGLKLAKAVKHPAGIPGEVPAKAGNISYAARWLSGYCREQRIDPGEVVVTTLDTDNRPHHQYLAALAHAYITTPDRTTCSYQPVPLFTNNIWDAPTPMRVVAADTSFWFMMDSMRPRRLRLFSAYAQSLKTLEDTNYWNVMSIVEDGHQYWRTYFTYHGHHRVVPIWLPIYQDAVATDSLASSMVVQFKQLLRWAWSTADTPYVIRQMIHDKTIGWVNKLLHLGRQIDDYLAWSTAPIVVGIAAWLPWIIEATRGHHSPLAFQLFHVIIALQLLALGNLVLFIVVYMLLLPSRPARYGSRRSLAMVLQWVLEPLTLFIFLCMPSLIANARLILGKPLEEFHATLKSRT